jgi:hypothetical protein
MWRPSSALTVGASGRFGGTLKVWEGDSVRIKADAPSRYGAAVRYDIVPGTGVALRADRTLWSQMNGLGSEQASAKDTWDYGLGIDALGPRLIGQQFTLRGGMRRRTLPFSASNDGRTGDRVHVRYRLAADRRSRDPRPVRGALHAKGIGRGRDGAVVDVGIGVDRPAVTS